MSKISRFRVLSMSIIAAIVAAFGFILLLFPREYESLNLRYILVIEAAAFVCLGAFLMLLAFYKRLGAFLIGMTAVGLEIWHLILLLPLLPLFKWNPYGGAYQRAFVIYLAINLFVVLLVCCSLLLALFNKRTQFFGWLSGCILGVAFGLLLIALGAHFAGISQSIFWKEAFTLTLFDIFALILFSIGLFIHLGSIIRTNFPSWIATVVALACLGGAFSSWSAFNASEKKLIFQDMQGRGRILASEVMLESRLYFLALKRFAIRWANLPAKSQLVQSDGLEYLKDFPFLLEILADRENLNLYKEERRSIPEVQELLLSDQAVLLSVEIPELKGALIQNDEILLINWFEAASGEKIYFIANFSKFLGAQLPIFATRDQGYRIESPVGVEIVVKNFSSYALKNFGALYNWNYFGMPLRLEVWPKISANNRVEKEGGTYHLVIGFILSIALGMTIYFMLQARRKRLEAEATNLEKNFFFANISHELRTPLHGILGALSILETQELDPAAKRWVEGMQKSSRSLHELINELIDLSAMELYSTAIAHEKVDLYALAHETVDRFSNQFLEKKIEFKINYPDQMPRLFLSDPFRLRRILYNLLSNAIKYTKEGEIILACSAKEKLENHYAVTLAVSDTGCGIDEKDLSKIFEKYKRMEVRNQEGSGLGLAIAKRLAESLGGEIQVESILGAGSQFTLCVEMEAC